METEAGDPVAPQADLTPHPKPEDQPRVKKRTPPLAPEDVEIKRAQERGSLTQKALYHDSMERRVSDLKEDRYNLQLEVTSLRRSADEVSKELTELKSRYRALKEAMRATTANGTQAAVEVVLGGAAISAGSAFDDKTVKWCFIAAGLVGVVLGSVLSIRTNWSAVPPDQRGESA